MPGTLKTSLTRRPCHLSPHHGSMDRFIYLFFVVPRGTNPFSLLLDWTHPMHCIGPNGNHPCCTSHFRVPASLASDARMVTCTTGLRASSAVGTVAELTARTVEDGGDTHSISADLVPWLHERLLHQYGKYRRGGASGDVRGGISESTPARRSWAEGSTSGERASPNTLILNGGATAERPRTAEWILCHPSTAHCTQRGAPGSKFSCGYRNIQMLCSALLHFPEYKR